VFISFGGLFFLAFLAAAVFCCIKRRKKKTVEETDIIHVDEQRKVKEAIIEGAHGPQFGEGLHDNSGDGRSAGNLEE
jgi:hypothetical protein